MIIAMLRALSRSSAMPSGTHFYSFVGVSHDAGTEGRSIIVADSDFVGVYHDAGTMDNCPLIIETTDMQT